MKSNFCAKDLSNVRAIAHGKGKEKIARTIYAKKMQQKVPGFAVFDAGISVHPKFPFLGATPDGKVFDPSSNSKYGLLEVNCVLFQNEEILSIKQQKTQPFILKKLGLIFTLRKVIHILPKYKDSWPLLVCHGVTFVFTYLTRMKCV